MKETNATDQQMAKIEELNIVDKKQKEESANKRNSVERKNNEEKIQSSLQFKRLI